jgi:hypothetical protein
MVLSDFRIDEFAAQRFEAFERAFLIRYFDENILLFTNRYGIIARVDLSVYLSCGNAETHRRLLDGSRV